MKTVGINNIIKIILTVLVILFVIYFWPTPYKYVDRGVFVKIGKAGKGVAYQLPNN